MDINILADLVVRVMESNSPSEQVVLTAEESRSFQSTFSADISKQLEEIRQEKTRVLEEFKNLAVR